MTGNLVEPYPAYRPSGVEWLGEVPAHWGVRRLRNLARTFFSNVDKHSKNGEQPVRICNYSDVYYNERIRNDLDFMAVTATAEEIGKYQLHTGDVLITKDSESWDDIGVPAFVESTDHDIVCGYHLALLRPLKGRAFGMFLCRALSGQGVANQLFIKANGVTRFGLSQTAIRSVWLPTPPLPEQAAIARFLDHMDRRITRCISAKEKLIVLLEEYRQAVVSEAVMGRFDVRTGKPYPAYRPSGVEWLGEVPAHWKVQKLKRWLNINDLVLPEDTDTEYTFDYLDIGAVETGRLATMPQRIRFGGSPSRARRVVRAGDTLVSTVRTYLKAVWWYAGRPREPLGKLIASTGFAVLTPRANTHPKFVSYVCQSDSFTNRVTADSAGIAYPAIAETRLGTLEVCVPPLVEQTAIARFLDGKIEKIREGVARAQGEIDLLGEYRTRLIADVVTGKLDVRAAAAGLPETDPLAPADGADAPADADDALAPASPDRAA